MEGPSDPRWYNALYGSRTPSPGSEPAEKAATPVSMQPGSSTLKTPPGDQVRYQCSQQPLELHASVWRSTDAVNSCHLTDWGRLSDLP